MKNRKMLCRIIAAAVVLCTVGAALFLISPWETGGDLPEELTPDSTYICSDFIYISPLSSFQGLGGDSGQTYTVEADHFTITERTDGSTRSFDLPSREWRPFPYTDEEWARLCSLEDDAMVKPEGWKISELPRQYSVLRCIPLTQFLSLVQADGELWLMSVFFPMHGNPYLQSIYHLTLEEPPASEGTVTVRWTYEEDPASDKPAFRFELSMDYTLIIAACRNGRLVDHDNRVKHAEKNLTFKEGHALYWTPVERTGDVARETEIGFSVRNGGPDAPLENGTLRITSEIGADGRIIYTAILVGGNLTLAQNTDRPGGIISLKNGN